MLDTRISIDPAEIRRLWEHNWPRNCLFDLWEVRACFDRAYERPPYFLSVHEGDECRGMMALSWIDEEKYYGHFPGELWHGRTWLEQNRIPASSPEVFRLLWDLAPAETEIRYLSDPGFAASGIHLEPDEVGYLFFPKDMDFNFDGYWSGFSGKSRKKIRSELNRLEAAGVSFRHDNLSDIELMFQFNLNGFSGESYFNDARFLKAFSELAAWLHDNRMLRITTVLIGGEVAAVDMGALWQDSYTVLAGGTRAEFPGVAKLINLHHLKWSCQQRLSCTDFLCGDFNWKNRFRLTPRPLYQMKKASREAYPLPLDADLKDACAQ